MLKVPHRDGYTPTYCHPQGPTWYYEDSCSIEEINNPLVYSADSGEIV